MIHFILNETTIATDLPPGMVILDFIRYHKALTGTKIGCREGDCGACTILVGEIKDGKLHYRSMTSCLMALGNAHGKHIVTIEGINMQGLNPIQEAMAEEGATQCGFCTPGFVMSFANFCLGHREPNYKEAISSIDGNICRCTGYKSIERAAARITKRMSARNEEAPERFAADQKILPVYFAGIKEKLLSISNGQFDKELENSSGPPLGGGTDLYVQRPEEMIHGVIRFLFNQQELKKIYKESNNCIVGPSATVTDLQESKTFNEALPEFRNYVRLISSTPIRNMATIAGNIINASPIGDFSIFFLALNAQLTLMNNEQEQRTIALDKLYKGYKQLDKSPAEYIENISFEIPGPSSLFHFEKVSKRTHLDIASVNSAIALRMEADTIKEARISAGGVAPIPLFLEKTSRFLAGKTINEELIFQVIEIMQSEISPISDARGSKEYKALLLGQLIKAHFIKLFPKVNSGALVS